MQEKVVEAVMRASDIVQRILVFARTGPPSTGPIDMFERVHDSLVLIKAAVPSTTIVVEELDKDSGDICGDPADIEIVIMNLMSNALDAMGGRRGVLTVNLARVVIDAPQKLLSGMIEPGQFVRLTVSDTGCGIEPNDLERLFEPFFTTKPIGKGTGLGLPAVHGVVSSYGGYVDVASVPGKGTSFSVYLPSYERISNSAEKQDGTVVQA